MLVDGLPLTAEELSQRPAVARLRQIVQRTGALSVPLPYGHRPSDDDLDTLDDERESWWYRVPSPAATA